MPHPNPSLKDDNSSLPCSQCPLPLGVRAVSTDGVSRVIMLPNCPVACALWMSCHHQTLHFAVGVPGLCCSRFGYRPGRCLRRSWHYCWGCRQVSAPWSRALSVAGRRRVGYWCCAPDSVMGVLFWCWCRCWCLRSKCGATDHQILNCLETLGLAAAVGGAVGGVDAVAVVAAAAARQTHCLATSHWASWTPGVRLNLRWLTGNLCCML